MIEMINCMINKIIFNKVNTVRFLVPLTHDQINVGRGGEVQRQIGIINMICQENIEAVASSCLPIITKVAQVKEDKDCNSIDVYRDLLD